MKPGLTKVDTVSERQADQHNAHANIDIRLEQLDSDLVVMMVHLEEKVFAP